MKILIVTQYFWPENFIINDLVKKLCQEGYLVNVITGFPNYPGGKIFHGYSRRFFKKEKFEKAQIIRVPTLFDHSNSKTIRALSYLTYLVSMSTVGVLYLKNEYDIIFTYQPGSIFVGLTTYVLGLKIKAKKIIWIQDLWPEALVAARIVNSKLVEKFISSISTWIYLKNNLLLVQSTSYINYLHQSRNISRDIIEYIPNWSMNENKIIDRPSDNFNVLYIGNIGKYQQIETLIRIANYFNNEPRIKFTIIGDGSNYKSVEILVTELNCKNVELIKKSNYNNLNKYIARASILYIQLVHDPILALTIPGKLQAYLSYGKPIFGAVSGEAAKIIKDADSGFLSTPLDYIMQIEKMKKVMSMPRAELLKYGINGHEYYKKHFDRNKNIKNIISIMEQLTKCR